jgi:hypothetical protein
VKFERNRFRRFTAGCVLGAAVEHTPWDGGRLTPQQWAQLKAVTPAEYEIAESAARVLTCGSSIDRMISAAVADWRRQITLLELSARIANSWGYVAAGARGRWVRLADVEGARGNVRYRHLPGGSAHEAETGELLSEAARERAAQKARRRAAMIEALVEQAAELGRPPTLKEFLTGAEIEYNTALDAATLPGTLRDARLFDRLWEDAGFERPDGRLTAPEFG